MVVRVVAMVGLLVSLVGTADAGPTKREAPPYVTGPKLVDLGNHAEIDLPAGMILFERIEAQRLLRKAGEPAEDVVAIVRRPESDWSVILSYSGTGYVNDSEPSALDAGELLAAYRAGTEAQNERRRALGTPKLGPQMVPELVIDGWAEPPHYDRTQHHLVWGVAAHRAGRALVNHFTRILGRDGFLSVNLIDAAETIDRSRLEVRSIVQATRFQRGSRYEDHTPSDGSSGARLASLVLSGSDVATTAKLGLLAQIVVVFKPEMIAFLLGIGGLLRRWLRRRPRGPKRAVQAERVTADATSVTGVLW